MPIYECYCEACRITFEILAPVTEANRKRPCPRCARASRRVVSAFAIGNAGTRGDTPAADSPAHSPAHADQSYSPVAQMVARKKAEQAKKAAKAPKPGASNTSPR